MARAVVPEAEEILDRYFPVLDHGFIALVDYMGDDQAIIDAAHTSYGLGTKRVSEDRGLARYLYRQRHTSPSEMVELKFHCKMPIFVARQWIRHRTACLAADVLLHFDLPGGVERRGSQLYKLSVGEVFERFQPTRNTSRPERQKDPHFKKTRIQSMMLRCLDEENGAVQHTNIVDIWQTGVKPVYRVELVNGANTKMSQDHLCLTDAGWRKLKHCALLPAVVGSSTKANTGVLFSTIGPGVDTGVEPHPNSIDEATEQWTPIIGWEDFYEVSDQGRVRRIVGGRGSRSFGRCKKNTTSQGHAVVSLNRPGVQETRLVHALMLEAFVGTRPVGCVARHLDGNGLNNRLINLEWSEQQDNADDRVRDGATTRLLQKFIAIKRVTYVGDEMTYDLEVAGPWHNFSADGMVVHNSVNEYSGRYSLLPMQFYTPKREQVTTQSTSNKQGRSSNELQLEEYERFLKQLNDARVLAQDSYELFVDKFDVAREVARLELPLSLYTEWYWKIDGHNLTHFLGQRCDAHAQWEVRQYANIMAGMLNRVAPLLMESWIDYHPNMGGVLLSRQEIGLLRKLIRKCNNADNSPELITTLRDDCIDEQQMKEVGMSNREVTAFCDLFDGLKTRPLPNLELDLSVTKDAAYFAEQTRLHAPKIERK